MTRRSNEERLAWAARSDARTTRRPREGDLYIVSTGTIVEGFEFFGPFPSRDAAIEWADENMLRDFWVATLIPKEVSE
jgi:hypothetical protein